MESMSTENPSLSSSSTSFIWKHQVLCSFLCADTMSMNFVDHLDTAFKQKGILTFRTDDLPSGIPTSEMLSKAIQKSMFTVVVISPDYASSRRCLLELTEIMKCSEKTAGLRVLPVFCNVDPSDVRKQTGTFGKGFAMLKHNSQVHRDTMEEWRAALTYVANLSGWSFDAGRDESALVREITKYTIDRLYGTVSFVDHQLVGIRSRVEKVMDMLGMELNGVRFVGICGIGGRGKTTLAKAVYGMVSLQFEASSFISSVREQTEKHDLVSLQNKLISDILKGKEINMHDLNEGVTVLGNQMRDRKILIVLDDVNSETQLEALVGSHDWFGPESKIILTSRDSNLLRRYADDVYEIEKLNNDEALKLFSLSAFKQPHPDENYVALSKEFISYARGHPLTLQVLGFTLSGRRIDIWKSDLDKLRVDFNKEILKNGKYRYDYCGGNQNHVEFKDIWVACLAFLLQFALFWVTNTETFERVVLVVSWINFLTTWALFLWAARSRGARFAFPRFVLPNQQPYGRTWDYFDKYAAIALIIFSTVHMIVKFTPEKFSASELILSAGILGAKWGIEHQERQSD